MDETDVYIDNTRRKRVLNRNVEGTKAVKNGEGRVQKGMNSGFLRAIMCPCFLFVCVCLLLALFSSFVTSSSVELASLILHS